MLWFVLTDEAAALALELQLQQLLLPSLATDRAAHEADDDNDADANIARDAREGPPRESAQAGPAGHHRIIL